MIFGGQAFLTHLAQVTRRLLGPELGILPQAPEGLTGRQLFRPGGWLWLRWAQFYLCFAFADVDFLSRQGAVHPPAQPSHRFLNCQCFHAEKLLDRTAHNKAADSRPPATPDKNGRYPVPQPGFVTKREY
jgi:hypothetical protein